MSMNDKPCIPLKQFGMNQRGCRGRGSTFKSKDLKLVKLPKEGGMRPVN